MVCFSRIYRLYLLLIVTLSIYSSSILGQDRIISAEVQITATAINRFISAQTFPTLNGTIREYTYSITITKPIVQLNTNSASVQFIIQANTNVGNFTFNVQPIITIPNLSVSTAQIIAVLQGFDDLINSRSDIPEWLKPIIINGYNSLNLVAYPSKLIDYANESVPDFMDVQVTDISLSLIVAPGLLKFTLAATAHGTPPLFQIQWMLPQAHHLSFRFKGSVATTVNKVTIYDNNGYQMYRNENLNYPIIKGGISDQIDISNTVSGNKYYVSVLYISTHGEYRRLYAILDYTGQYNTWFTVDPDPYDL